MKQNVATYLRRELLWSMSWLRPGESLIDVSSLSICLGVTVAYYKTPGCVENLPEI